MPKPRQYPGYDPPLTHPSERKRQRVRRLGFRPVWTADEWMLLERLRIAGKSWLAIGKALSRSPTSCAIAWCRYGPSKDYERLQRFLHLCRSTVNHALVMVNDNPQLLGGDNHDTWRTARARTKRRPT